VVDVAAGEFGQDAAGLGEADVVAAETAAVRGTTFVMVR